MSQATAPKISILGDGISTFEGYTPRLGSFYSPSYVSYSGFDSAEGTWWMQAIKKLGGSVLCNNSFSGSYVSYLGHYAAMLPGRIRNLATEEDSPDMILIYTGINDVANDIPLDAFQRDYTDMLQKIHRFHSGAEIWAGTLCMGQAPSSGRPYYIEPEHFQNIDAYNTVIRTCVKAEHAHLVDLAAHGVTYETVNGLHPNKAGMVTFADAWVDLIKQQMP